MNPLYTMTTPPEWLYEKYEPIIVCTYCDNTNLSHLFIYNRFKEPVCDYCLEATLSEEKDMPNEPSEFTPEALENFYKPKTKRK